MCLCTLARGRHSGTLILYDLCHFISIKVHNNNKNPVQRVCVCSGEFALFCIINIPQRRDVVATRADGCQHQSIRLGGGRLGHTEFAQGHVTFNAMMIDRYRERLGKFAICSFTVNKPATYEINYLCTTRTHNIYILYIAQTTFYDNDTNTPQPRMYTDIYLTNTHTPERIECTFAHFDSYINSITSVQCEIVWKMNGVRSPYKYIPTEKKNK